MRSILLQPSSLVGLVSRAAAILRETSSRFSSFYSAPKGYRTIHRLNRSQRWPRARSYQHARQMSPYPDMPVR